MQSKLIKMYCRHITTTESDDPSNDKIELHLRGEDPAISGGFYLYITPDERGDLKVGDIFEITVRHVTSARNSMKIVK